MYIQVIPMTVHTVDAINILSSFILNELNPWDSCNLIGGQISCLLVAIFDYMLIFLEK